MEQEGSMHNRWTITQGREGEGVLNGPGQEGLGGCGGGLLWAGVRGKGLEAAFRVCSGSLEGVGDGPQGWSQDQRWGVLAGFGPWSSFLSWGHPSPPELCTCVG